MADPAKGIGFQERRVQFTRLVECHDGELAESEKSLLESCKIAIPVHYGKAWNKGVNPMQHEIIIRARDEETDIVLYEIVAVSDIRKLKDHGNEWTLKHLANAAIRRHNEEVKRREQP
jgi:hypothetical protein